MRKLFWLMVVLAFAVGTVQAGYLTPGLQGKVEKVAPGVKLKVIVRMDREADISAFQHNQREAMVRSLQSFAAQSQKDLLATLPGYGDKVSKVRPFWIYNGIAMEATREVVLDLVKRPDVGYIEEDGVVHLFYAKGKSNTPKAAFVPTPEWNIDKVMADSCWIKLGIDGTGVVLGTMDTGVLVSHTAFHGRWRGGSNSWFDGVNGQTSPYDDMGHGTFTMGITTGGDGTGSDVNDIGVAPGATFVCCKAFDSGGSGQYSWIDACYQWLAGLGSAAPQVVGNSWGGAGTDTHFWQESRNLQVMGIHQTYANGNSGPGSGTVGAPGSYPHHIGVGATDADESIASYSSRGPSPAFGTMESTAYYLDPNWASSRRKPDLSAPGGYNTLVRSSLNDGSYGNFGYGTSYACPHVTGAVALMLQKNPNLTEQQIWQILTSSCDTPAVGRPYPNQNYGWGRLNCYRAVMQTPSASGPNIILSGFSYSPAPMPGVTVAVVDTVANNGQGDLTGAQGTLQTSSPYAHLTDSTYAFGTIAAGTKVNNGSSPFHFTVDPGTPYNTSASFNLHIVGDTTGGQYIKDLPFSILLNPHLPDTTGTDFYIMGDGDNLSGTAVATALYNLGYKGKFYKDSTFVGYPAIAPYRSVWVFVTGLHGSDTTYQLMRTGQSDETQMVNYLNAGGRMFFQHPDLGWACDPTGGMNLQNLYPMFHVGSYNDYSGNMSREVGTTGHFADGMNFAYNPADTGANGGNDIDALTPGSGAFSLFTSQTAGENHIIAYDSGTYRSLASCLAFVGLTDSLPPSTQQVLADSIMHWFGIFEGVQASGTGKVLPRTYELGPARPNPMSGSAAISFALPMDSKVSLKVYNLAGQLVTTLVDGKLPAGYHEARWDGRGLSSGVYFYRLEAGSYSATRKLVVVR